MKIVLILLLTFGKYFGSRSYLMRYLGEFCRKSQ